MALMLPAAGAFAEGGDADSGQRIFNQCRACHTIEAGGRNGVGPNLNGIYNRAAGQRENFRYSANLREQAAAGLTWNDATLTRYLTNPKDVLPQGAMSFPGLRQPQQVADVIAFLQRSSTPQ
ncbi:cytochrome c family protein [Roseomonas arctica]|uniref:Cytochrome c family protein n=2 Tax=Plastoroseomonas arctica TaxID=1509237 RepID=A0AAF1KHI3_9PROT|nr:cytochrome c family protein [Plastoroseomonas arctica]